MLIFRLYILFSFFLLVSCGADENYEAISESLILESENIASKIVSNNHKELIAILKYLKENSNEYIAGSNFPLVSSDLKKIDVELYEITKIASEIGVLSGKRNSYGIYGLEVIRKDTKDFKFTYAIASKSKDNIDKNTFTNTCNPISKEGLCLHKKSDNFYFIYSFKKK